MSQIIVTPSFIKSPEREYSKIESFEGDPALYASKLGTPVVIDLTFGGFPYFETVAGNEVERYSDPLTLVTVLCHVHQSKNIVQTSIPYRDGTIKEYIGLGDYEITIEGKITGENGKMPEQEIQALHRILKAKATIPITNRWLNLLGIFYIVVKDYNLPQQPGGISYQDFSIECLSDETYTAQLL